MKKIIVLRHAKAGDHSGDDHERPLVQKGIIGCSLIGNFLKENNIVPQIAITSTALRAKQTASHVLSYAKISAKITETRTLYLATSGEIYKEIGKIDDKIESVMIVGHNPGFHQFCINLTGSGNEDLRNLMITNFPTAAIAVFSVNKLKWSDISIADGHLDFFTFPKALKY